MTEQPARVLPPPTLVHRLEYAALRILVGVLSLLPRRVRAVLGGAAGRLGYWPFRIRRRVVELQLAESFPEMNARQRARIAAHSYAHLGRVAVETSIASGYDAKGILDLFYEESGWEHVANPIRAGQGVILVSAHLGNWELGAAYMSARGVPVSAVTRRMRNPLFDAYITRARRRLGWKVVYDHDAVRKLPRAIADGHVVPMLADQGVKGLAATFVPFFGRLARTPKGPALFALRLKAPMVIGIVTRRADGMYAIHFEPIAVTNTGDRDRDVDTLVAEYTRAVEKWVRRFPDQYLWQHRRWRRRPDGTLAY